jgi:hypothetical protein
MGFWRSALAACSMGGRSRSPAIIIAFMMSTMGMTYDRCVGRVRAARNVVALNQGEVMCTCLGSFPGHNSRARASPARCASPVLWMPRVLPLGSGVGHALGL